MSDQSSGVQEPQATPPDANTSLSGDPDQSVNESCPPVDQFSDASAKGLSAINLEGQSMSGTTDENIAGGDLAQNNTEVFVDPANLSDIEAEKATRCPDDADQSDSRHLDAINRTPSEENLDPATSTGQHVVTETTDETEALDIGPKAELFDDDEVQIIGDNWNTTRCSSGARSPDHIDRVVVDLTLDDDDDDGDDTYGDMTFPEQTSNLVIKKESVDDNLFRAMEEDVQTSRADTGAFHGLPAFEPTALPGENEATLLGGGFNHNEDITPGEMSAIFERYNANCVDTTVAADTSAVDDGLSDEEDSKKRAEFTKLKKKHEALKRNGNLTTIDAVNFTRAAREEDARLQARKNRKQHEYDEENRQEESLFIPEQSALPDLHADDGNSDDLPSHAYVSASVTLSPAPQDCSEQNAPARKSGRGRPKGSKAKPTQQKTAGKSRVAKQPGSGVGAGAKRGRKSKQPAPINPDSLLHHDIIAEATANQGQASQPGFTSRVKKDALAQLISSIPIEERNLYAGDKANLHKATLKFNGRGAIKADGNGNWKLKEMKSSLRNYQLMGVAWMRERETQNKNPRGGVLGDDMGLGKTVSVLANMVDGKPGSNHTGPTATLIIVPPSLMGQWMSEIDKHTQNLRKVMIYKSKMKFLDPIAQLSSQDVVITSYHEVARSFPNNAPPPEIYTAKARAEWWEKEIADHKGPLHEIYWHRIVLDEAQAIKNHLSKTSEAICRLKGCFRWCLSGTPVQNSLEEFYPYFKFLRYPNTGSFELFKRNFTKRNSDKAILRLQAVLGEIMLRRTHVDKLFGRPILTLPPIKPMQTIEVKFNAVERAVYNIVKHRFVMRIKALAQKDNVNNSYQHIFVLLLRLRQLIAHPLLIQKTLKDLLEIEDLERLWSLTQDNRPPSSNEDAAPDGNSETANALQVALTQAGSPLTFPGTRRTYVVDNQLSTDFRKYLDALRKDGNWAKANERSLCSACGSPPSQPYLTSCLHLYCLSCLNDLHFSEYMQKKEEANCLYCQAKIKSNEAYAAKAFTEAGRTGKTPDDRQTPEEDIDWYSVGGPILRSAKIKGAVAQIKKWFDQDSTNKIIVFTQFRGVIRVMERVCREEDWGSSSYHGAMSFEHRDEQLRDFADKPEKRILLAAMKAGGVGLNLTAANRVIIMDLWWNSSVEMQAFTRCFRIGQKRDVEVARFVVTDTMDTDILRMQERKKLEIESAMEKRHRLQLSVEDLIELFDPVRRNQDEDGGGRRRRRDDDNGDDEPFVFPDDPYDTQNEEEDVVMVDAH